MTSELEAAQQIVAQLQATHEMRQASPAQKCGSMG